MNNKHTSYEEIDNDKYEYHQNTLENSMNAMRLDGEKKHDTNLKREFIQYKHRKKIAATQTEIKISFMN